MIVLAKAVEESQDAALNWTPADSEAASLKIAHALGESATADRILHERAKTILSTLADKGVSSAVGTKATVTKILAPLFILLAFVLGALTDRIASPEHIVNLLSFPFWSVIVWNLGVYVVLALCVVGLFSSANDRFALPFRKCLVSFVEKSAFTTLRKGFKAEFYAQWTNVCAPLVRMQVAKTLHLAAVFFALGIIVSLLVRGFGTAYWAGWESTWLSESPESVKTFLDLTFGWIPQLASLPALPDVETLSQWRIDRLPYLSEPVSAAPWLIRMMIVMGVAVIVPRLIFFAFNLWRVRHYAQNVPLDLDTPYYQAILSQCRQDAKLGRLGIVANHVARPSREHHIDLVRRLWGTETDSEVLTTDFDIQETPLPSAPEGERNTVMLLWLDGMETPEVDTHGQVIEKAKALYGKSQPLAIWLDMAEFAERFASTPERIAERQKHWMEFIAVHDVKSFVMLDMSQTGVDTVKALRAWAAGQPIVPVAEAPVVTPEAQ